MKEDLEEVWKPLYDFEHYEVSNTGKIRSTDQFGRDSLNRPYTRKGRVLKARNVGKKKYFVDISNIVEDANGNHKKKRNTIYLHKAVGETFLENDDEEKTKIVHKDGDITNNHISNLKWATASEAYQLGMKRNTEDDE